MTPALDKAATGMRGNRDAKTGRTLDA